MTPRGKTKEEVIDELLEYLHRLVNYWSSIDTDNDTKGRMEGLVHSILCIFDGVTEMPPLDIILWPHPDDKQYRINRGENYYVAGLPINDNVMLHELWYRGNKDD